MEELDMALLTLGALHRDLAITPMEGSPSLVSAEALVGRGMLVYLGDRDGKEYYQITEKGLQAYADDRKATTQSNQSGDEREGSVPSLPDAVLQPTPVLGEPAPADVLPGVWDEHLPGHQVGELHLGGEPGVAEGGGPDSETDRTSSIPQADF